MNNPNIGGESPDGGLANVFKQPEIEIEPTETSSSARSSGRGSSSDSVSSSQARRREYEEDDHDSKNPRLRHPSYMQFLLHCQDEMEKLTNDIAEEWNKSLQEEADQIQAELKSPKYLAFKQQQSTQFINEEFARSGKDLVVPTKDATDLAAALATSTAEEKRRYEGLQDRYYFIAGLSKLLAATKETMETAPTEALTASLAIGAGFASSFSRVPSIDSSSQVEAKTFHEAWKDIVPQNDQITQTGGWFSAMWSIGLVYQLSAQNIAHRAKDTAKEAHREVKFAKAYVESLLESLEGGAFNASMAALLTPILEHAPETSEEQDPGAVATKGKIVLLAMALALLIKVEGKDKDPDAEIDEDTFAAALKGFVNFSKEDAYGTAELKRRLVERLHECQLALPAAERSPIFEGILAYIGRRPDVEDLLDQQKVFAEVLSDSAFEQTLVDKRPLDV